MKNLIIISLLLVVLSSCFKEEEPREGFTSYVTINMGSDYYDQIFYSLADTTIISSNNYLDWNLGFYSGADKSYIKLNAAANMWVYKTNSTDFNINFPINYNEEDKRFDGSNGFDDHLAIDQILPTTSNTDTVLTDQQVYLIHPGYKANGDEIGDYKKMVFIGMFEDAYIVKYADLDGSNQQIVSIPKNNTINYVAFSWESNSIVNVEPDKTTWDLLFSRFTDTVYTTAGDEFLTGYAVSGTYLNQGDSDVSAYIIEDIAYEDISIDNFDESKLSTKLNIIGHTWKQFSDQYSILQNRSYIVKDRNGYLFKLHFLSFYDPETGQKGYPSFEFELL